MKFLRNFSLIFLSIICFNNVFSMQGSQDQIIDEKGVYLNLFNQMVTDFYNKIIDRQDLGKPEEIKKIIKTFLDKFANREQLVVEDLSSIESQIGFELLNTFDVINRRYVGDIKFANWLCYCQCLRGLVEGSL